MKVLKIYNEWLADVPCQFRDKKNITAVINAFSRQLEELLEVNGQLTGLTDLDSARGKNLDMLGDIVNMSRRNAYLLLNRDISAVIDDETYRNVLRFQALKNNSDATYADIMKGMYLLWGHDVQIKYAEAVREPASIEISIADITTDDTDPALIRPMVIRAGGVKILFRSSYTDKINMSGWERFGNAAYAFGKNHRWNGAYQWNGAIRWHAEGISFSRYWDGENCFDGKTKFNADGVKYRYFDGTNRFDGKTSWGKYTEKEDTNLGDAVLLNQAKKKMLRMRFDGTPVKIAQFVFGSGLGKNKKPYEPDPDQTELRNEILRKSIDSRSMISDTCYRYHGMLSEIEGNGQYISEIGLADEEGMLLCIKTFDRKLKNLEAEMTFRIDDMF